MSLSALQGRLAWRTTVFREAGLIFVLIVTGIVAGLLIVVSSPLSEFLGQSVTLAVLIGALAGLLAGLWIGLDRRIRWLEEALGASGWRADASGDVGSSEPSRAGPASGRDDRDGRRARPSTKGVAPVVPESAGPRSEVRPRRTERDGTGLTPLLARARDWLTEGNLPVKVGVLVSFVGVAALLRYAAEQGWLQLPIELRLAGVALAALAALAFAWRQRLDRRVFALSLQGGAIGVLVLTVFAAFRMYGLLPAPVAFALLLALVGATGVLAVAQRALALAVLGLAAGFAAPILVSTGSGDHVVLFGYYTVLNVAVFGIAWREDWILLNRLGLLFTFVVATFWGVLDYRPALYASTQPFLVAFFAMYASIPVIQARTGRDRGKLDVMLVFGLPLIAFPLQMALVDGRELPVAFSALAVAGVYSLNALDIRRHVPAHPLLPATVALAIGFATLAVPFAFAGPVIALVWAAEGAALVWLGLMQRRRAARRAGLTLQLLAGVAWYLTSAGPEPAASLVVLNGPFLGALAIVLAGAFSAWRYGLTGASGILVNTLAVWALGWWLLSGWIEIDAKVAFRYSPDAWLAFSGLTAWLAAHAFRLTGRLVPGLAVVAMVVMAVLMLPVQTDLHERVFGGWGLPAWAAFLVVTWAGERALRTAPEWLRGMTAVGVHLAWLAAAGTSLFQASAQIWGLGSGWQWLAAGAPALLIAAWLARIGTAPLTPGGLPTCQRDRLGVVIGIVLVGGLAFSLFDAGDPAPLPFVPLANPLELGQFAALLLITSLVRRVTGGARGGATGRIVWSLAGLLALVAVSLVWLRAAHQLAGIPWQMLSLARSELVQAGLSVIWTLVAVALWVGGSRRLRRAVWLAGALLLAIVLVKLLMFDRRFLSTMAGIVSFLAYGGLCIIVGFLAPAPPGGPANPEPRPGEVA